MLLLLFCLQDKLLNSMNQEAPELAGSGQAGCVTCLESKAVMMVFPCNHTALCRLCFVKMIKHVMKHTGQGGTFSPFILVSAGSLSRIDPSTPGLYTFSYKASTDHPVLLPSLSCVVLAVAGLDIRENKLRGCRLYLSWTCSR